MLLKFLGEALKMKEERKEHTKPTPQPKIPVKTPTKKDLT